jgi:hypothetical protein
MLKSEKIAVTTTLVLIVLITLLNFGWMWICASQEAATYNKITGTSVTTWDALWVELRVDSQPKKRD